MWKASRAVPALRVLRDTLKLASRAQPGAARDCWLLAGWLAGWLAGAATQLAAHSQALTKGGPGFIRSTTVDLLARSTS